MNRKHHSDTLHEKSLDPNGELETVLSRVIARLDVKSLAQQFREQDGFAFIENFLTEEELSKYFLPSVESAKPYIHRNYIPLHKKGGSISSYSIAQNAPTFSDLYRSRTFGDFITLLTSSEKKLLLCPPEDAHAVALYFYTEAGDHIGWHYDSSFYDGKRFTVLLGLVDNSSCELVCELYRNRTDRKAETRKLKVNPGALVVFDGDKLYHCVTPSKENENRVILSMEFVTDQNIGIIGRALTHVKDAVTYFGIGSLFGKYEGYSGDSVNEEMAGKSVESVGSQSFMRCLCS